MAKLSDVRRWFPPEDPEAYAAAYAAAELAEDLGALVHDLRVAAGLSHAALAERMGADEDEVLRAEEGDASLEPAFFDRVARAVGVQSQSQSPASPTCAAAPTGRPPSPSPGS